MRKLSRNPRPVSPAILIALVCAITAVALTAAAATPDVASPAARG